MGIIINSPLHYLGCKLHHLFDLPLLNCYGQNSVIYYLQGTNEYPEEHDSFAQILPHKDGYHSQSKTQEAVKMKFYCSFLLELFKAYWICSLLSQCFFRSCLHLLWEVYQIYYQIRSLLLLNMRILSYYEGLLIAVLQLFHYERFLHCFFIFLQLLAHEN